VKSASGEIASEAWVLTKSDAAATVAPLASTCACTSVVSGLTNTDCAPLVPVAGDCSV
jgi:hypothetical protein